MIIKRFALVLISAIVLMACNNNEIFKVISQSDVVGNKNVTIQELEYDAEKLAKSFPGFSVADLKNGVYMFNASEDTSYILFHSEGELYSNISFNVKDKVLQITYQSEADKGLGMNSLFLVKKKDEKDFDTIDLQNNGETDHFNTVFVTHIHTT